MRWRKLGRVFVPDGSVPWMRTHAANPVPEPLGGDVLRVYFGGRDDQRRTSIGTLDLGLAGGTPRVLRVAAEPVVGPGTPGMFDDSGASMSSLVRDGDRTFLYYLGWNLGVTVPWRNTVGLAVRTGDGPFEKPLRAPVMDRCHEDPFTLSYPFVMRDGSRWRAWYGACTEWLADGGLTCGIKHAESDDGVVWRRDGKVVLGEAETGYPVLTRPWVVKDGGVYRMWFCERWPVSRSGYAESADGLGWTCPGRPAAPDVSPGEWDGEMVCYPCVFDHGGARYMLYNGDRYGLTGFGLAVQEQD